MSEISANFTVTGGTWRGMQIDTEGRSPDQIAELIEREFDGVSFCHQCTGDCEDPEGELNAFTLDDVDYEFVDGHWVAVEDRKAANR